MDGELIKDGNNNCTNNGELINRDGNQQRMDDKQMKTTRVWMMTMMNKDGNQKEKE